MALFLAHSLVLLCASAAAARPLTRHCADRIIAALLLAWVNLVATSLVLASIHRLGDSAWFFRTSLLLALATWLVLRKVTPIPPDPAPADEPPNLWLVVGLIVTLVPLTFANVQIAATYLPNNYDSLAYHLPRAEFYLGQNTLAHFDTGNPRQIYFPFNYNLLQLFGLIYGPPLQVVTFLNLGAWLISGLAIFRLCRLGGFSLNSSLVAAWLALTSTQILAQATATTNDLPTGAALLCTLVFALKWTQSRLTRDALLAGLGAGLTAGSKLTVLFFGPAVIFLILVFAYQHWRRAENRLFVAKVRAWIVPGLVAGLLFVPFAVINVVEKGEWINKTYDFTLNKPFSFACARQVSEGYLVQLFLEPLHRFSFDLGFTAQLNEWGTRTFFPHWNEAYAFSPLYLFPPDLNEDHVWYGFAGPLFLLCALFCVIRSRRLTTPVSWLALLGLGWLATYFLLNKWSLYNQRYFVPAILLMSPSVAALLEAARPNRRWARPAHYLVLAVALSSFWLAGVYLFKNTSRPFGPLLTDAPPPPALPTLPPVMVQRLRGEPRVNIDTADGNERIFLLMTMGHHQRFTASEKIDPNAYNVLSRWGFPRNVAYSNIEQLSSYTAVPIPTKRTAGVEFLGTIGTGQPALDYFGLLPHADQVAATDGNRNAFVTLYYGRRDPGRYDPLRIKIVGLNPGDHARLTVGIEYEDRVIAPLASFTTSGESIVAVTKPFRRFTINVVDEATGRKIGGTDIPYLFRDEPADANEPSRASSSFVSELVSVRGGTLIATDGLAAPEGPYPQWDLPIIRWAKAPIMKVKIPASAKFARLQVSFSARLQIREQGDLDVLLNGHLVQHYRLEGHSTWSDQTLALTPAAGDNVVEFRNVVVGTETDWLDYLDRYPDVKNYLVAQKIPLEKGAEEHYNLKGKTEGRVVYPKRQTEQIAAPDQLYFVFRSLRIEGFKAQ